MSLMYVGRVYAECLAIEPETRLAPKAQHAALGLQRQRIPVD
jgi:hypothetical protein